VSKRNSNRTKAPEVPPPGPDPDNNLFSFVTPTEFVELPSRGLFYGVDHPLHDSDVVEIRHMTAKEEDILTSEALLKSGMALNRLLQSVIVDKNVHPDTLLIGDKNAVLIAARQTGFGDIYTTSINCSECGKQNEKDFSLNTREIKESEIPEDVSLLENGNFLIYNKEYDLNLEIRLLKGQDETKITKILENRRKLKKDVGNITTMLESIIVAVNDIREPAAIQQVVAAMPVAFSRKVRSVYESVMPNIGLYADFECEFCDYNDRLEVPITLHFFWPDL